METRERSQDPVVEPRSLDVDVTSRLQPVLTVVVTARFRS